MFEIFPSKKLEGKRVGDPVMFYGHYRRTLNVRKQGKLGIGTVSTIYKHFVWVSVCDGDGSEDTSP